MALSRLNLTGACKCAMLTFMIFLLFCVVEGSKKVWNHHDYHTINILEERDKATHRSNFASIVYNLTAATQSFFVQAFPRSEGGMDLDANFFADFEDWEAGTFGWTVDGNIQRPDRTEGAHFNSFDFDLLGRLELITPHELIFNTTGDPPTLSVSNATDEWVIHGNISKTDNGTKVAVYNFLTIEIQPVVNVSAFGNVPLVIMSRSSIIWNTKITLPAAQLGGWPGSQAERTQQNLHGRGQSAMRVYAHTITTSGSNIDEIQHWETFATPGQRIGGGFTIECKGQRTGIISHDALPSEVEQKIHEAIPLVGAVSVSRSWYVDDQGGRSWNVTFAGAIGDVPQIIVTSHLTGVGANLTYGTHREANVLGGFFKVSFLSGCQTEALAFNISASEMRASLLKACPLILDATISRTDPGAKLESGGIHSGFCQDGLCLNGPGEAGGFVWTIVSSTLEGVYAAQYPTADDLLFSLPVENMTVDGTLMTGIGAEVTVVPYHTKIDKNSFLRSREGPQIETPFVLAYGGGGGVLSEAGRPNANGHAPQEASKEPILANADLIGGSGGAAGGNLPLSRLWYHDEPTGLGGDGGGVIEFVAVNDIFFPEYGVVVADGTPGKTGRNAGGGGSGGKIVLSAGGTVRFAGRLQANGGSGGKCLVAEETNCSGGDGTGGKIFVHAQGIRYDGSPKIEAIRGEVRVLLRSNASWFIDRTSGAFGTKQSLVLTGSEQGETSSGVAKLTPYFTGPQYVVRGGDAPGGVQPTRVTYYVKYISFASGTTANNYASALVLLPSGKNGEGGYSGPSKVEDGLEHPHPGRVATVHPTQATGGRVLLGITAQGGNLWHSANYDNFQTEIDTPEKKLQKLVMPAVQGNRWYKVDIFISWVNNTYLVRVDDAVRVIDAPFRGTGLRSVGLFVYHDAVTVYDEIYIGDEFTANFRCPLAIGNSNFEMEGAFMRRPFEQSWGPEVLGGNNTYKNMQRHSSHYSRRSRFRPEWPFPFKDGGLLPLGGPNNTEFINDVIQRSKDGDYDIQMGKIEYAMLLDAGGRGDPEVAESVSESAATTAYPNKHWSDGRPSGGLTGRVYWYGEHHGNDPRSFLNGSIVACSTVDFITWRNEGTMLHFANITDDFTGKGNVDLIAERPKVVYNKKTQQYVMWFHVDDKSSTRSLAGVAVSDYANGPFKFVRTFRPDGNETQDMTIMEDSGTGEVYLVRTYYDTTEYWLPSPVMQPLWESVKMYTPGGWENESVNFALNYHRAFYHPDYDDNDDICVQRLRKEQNYFSYAAEVDECSYQELDPPLVRYEEGQLDPETGEPFVNATGSVSSSSFRKDQCIRKTGGMGFPLAVKTRFKYPNYTYDGDALDGGKRGKDFNEQMPWTQGNDYFMPDSVPTVKAQPWRQNYEDGNIADNPPHPAMPDELIGVPRKVFSRRNKFVAISLLTENMLDITDWLNIMDGEAEERYLNSIVTQFGQFGFRKVDIQGGRTDHHNIWGSTFDKKIYEKVNMSFPERLGLRLYSEYSPSGANKPFDERTESDWATRYWQYDNEYNDRVNSPVNFKDQLNHDETYVDFRDRGPHRDPIARRQWKGRDSVNTLKDRAKRLPIDRNCVREGEEPPVFTNQLDMDSMFLMKATWDAEDAGGGVMGSSLNYDYDETYITRFNPSYTSAVAENANFGEKLKQAGGTPELMAGMMSTGSATASSGRLIGHVLIGRDTLSCGGKQCTAGVGVEDIKNDINCLCPAVDEDYSHTFPSALPDCNPGGPFISCFDALKTNVLKQGESYSYDAVGNVIVAAQTSRAVFFNGFHSSAGFSPFDSWLRIDLKTRSQDATVKVYTTWTPEALKHIFLVQTCLSLVAGNAKKEDACRNGIRSGNKVIKPAPVYRDEVYTTPVLVALVPTVQLEMYASNVPVGSSELESMTPCGVITLLNPYPDEQHDELLPDGGTIPQLCAGMSKYIYIINKTAALPEDDYLEAGMYYVMVANVDIIGPEYWPYVPVPHPPAKGTDKYGTGPWTYSVGESFYDEHHFYDPRWTYEKGLDPAFVNYGETGDDKLELEKFVLSRQKQAK